MKLSVKFMRFRNVVIAEILEQSKSLRGHTNIISDGVFSIKSIYRPCLGKNMLFIRGEDYASDQKVMACEFDSEQEAIDAVEHYVELIDKINKTDDKIDDKTFDVTVVE